MPTIVGGSQPAPPGGFDRQGIEQALARSPNELRRESSERLRGYLSQLDQARLALEAAPGLSASERRSLSDRLLARVVEVGLMLRLRPPEGPGDPAAPAEPGAGAHLFPGVNPAALLADNSLLTVVLLGGLIVAFAVGGLVGYRRGTRQATYYGEGDPRIRFLTRAPSRPVEQGKPPVIDLARIRERLAAGCAVQLQLGYAIAPSHRPRFLELLRQAQQFMEAVDGQHYTAWEDPRHPNRFYEVLVCQQTSALAPLTDPEGPLARIAEEIERCRIPGGIVLRRVWWEVSPKTGMPAGPPLAAEDSIERELGE